MLGGLSISEAIQSFHRTNAKCRWHAKYNTFVQRRIIFFLSSSFFCQSYLSDRIGVDGCRLPRANSILGRMLPCHFISNGAQTPYALNYCSFVCLPMLYTCQGSQEIFRSAFFAGECLPQLVAICKYRVTNVLH